MREMLESERDGVGGVDAEARVGCAGGDEFVGCCVGELEGAVGQAGELEFRLGGEAEAVGGGFGGGVGVGAAGEGEVEVADESRGRGESHE